MNKDANSKYQGDQFETIAIREQTARSSLREHSTALHMSSSFVFDDAEQARALFADEQVGNIYTRFSNPNNSEFVNKLAKLEGAEEGLAVASGISGIFTTLSALLSQGDHLVASCALFGSTHQMLEKILPRWGITHTYVPTEDMNSWDKAVTPATKIVLVETPSNPGLAILDLDKVSAFATKHNLLKLVDNTFATPWIQRPMEHGADVVIHSATKYIDGQGRAIGGAIVGKKDLIKEIRFLARHSGPSLSPFNSWLFSKSLETLALRMERHSSTAFQVAKYFEDHDDVEKVTYPFLESHPGYDIAKKQMRAGGGIVSVTVKGGLERGRRFLDDLTWFSHTANLGDSRTIATHPASTTHSKRTDEEKLKVGITPGLVRFSIGLEDPGDIISEIERSFKSTRDL